MSIRESYQINKLTPYTFVFMSVGEKGSILKGVIFEKMDNGKYNLAFGDIIENDIDDKVVR